MHDHDQEQAMTSVLSCSDGATTTRSPGAARLGHWPWMHGDGIRLLTSRTTERPDANRVVSALLEQRWPDLAPEHLERLRISEEARYADQHIGVQRREFLVVAVQELRVAFQCVVLGQHHATADASPDRARLIEREVD